MFGFRIFVLVLCFIGNCISENSETKRIKRQLSSNSNEELIDNIFNIPITAIRQTAIVAQSFSPENSPTIDNVFKIPISTLEAIGQFVKSKSIVARQSNNNRDRIRQQKLSEHQSNKYKNHRKDSWVQYGPLGTHMTGDREFAEDNSYGEVQPLLLRMKNFFEPQGFSSSSLPRIQNKLALRDKRDRTTKIPRDRTTTPVPNKIAPTVKRKINKEDNRPIKNKIAPKSQGILFRD